MSRISYRIPRSAAALVLALIAGSAFADPHARITNGSYPEHREAWTKLAVLGVKLGAPLRGQTGFTCGPSGGAGGARTCVKFLDDRCQGRTTLVAQLRYGSDAPKGHNCFLDEIDGITYLDQKKLRPPLKHVRITGTDTSSPLIFRIDYVLDADDLTKDSKLGKALVEKYGKPTHGPTGSEMSWEQGDVTLSASCRLYQGADGEFCEIRAEDKTLSQAERSLQDNADAGARQASAPAPKL